ncbi:MAG: hypothetical protein QM817_40765 [Archangium sp.]
MSKCAKCDSMLGFTVRTIDVKGVAWKMNAIQCVQCHAVVTFVEFFNIGALLRGLIRKMGFDPDKL